MAITRVGVSNFKSFRELELQLQSFNVFIGANASGKSNFIGVLKFFRDVVRHGLENAVSIQGGTQYLRNTRLGASCPLTFSISFDNQYITRIIQGPRLRREGYVAAVVTNTTYEFALTFHKRGSGFTVSSDRLILDCRLRWDARRQQSQPRVPGEHDQPFKVVISSVNGSPRVELETPPEFPVSRTDVSLPLLAGERLPGRTLLIESLWRYVYFSPTPESFLTDIALFDFDPKLPKKAVSITGRTELEEDGSNLSIVLQDIFGTRANKRAFSNLLSDLIPFVANLDVENFADRSLLFKISESYSPKSYFPASLVSDGTVHITALIAALYFQKNHIIVIEEPERNIHPYLISRIVQMLSEASHEKQVLITTHNPELVKNAETGSLVLVSRDEDGFTTLTRPTDRESVQMFLKNEIGIEELYVQNLLGVL